MYSLIQRSIEHNGPDWSWSFRFLAHDLLGKVCFNLNLKVKSNSVSQVKSGYSNIPSETFYGKTPDIQTAYITPRPTNVKICTKKRTRAGHHGYPLSFAYTVVP